MQHVKKLSIAPVFTIKDEEKEQLSKYIDAMKGKYDLSFLSKDHKKCAELNFKSPEEVEYAKMTARENAIKVMNVVRYSSPLLKIVCDKEKTDEGRSKLFVEFNERLIGYAKRVMIIWNISPEDINNNWILNVLTRTFAQGFSTDMILNDSEIDKLAAEVYNVAELTLEKRYDQSFSQNMTTSVKLAIIKSATPIYNSLQVHQFLKSREDLNVDCEKIISVIVNKAAEAVGILSKEMTEEKDRVMLFKVLLEEAGKMFSNIWDNVGMKFEQKYADASKEEIELKRKNGGVDKILEYCVSLFNNQFDNLVKLSKIV